GAATSDEILDPGSRGMYFFRYFIPEYQKWTGSAPNLQSDIEARYDELRGINFGKFRTDASDLDAAHGKLSDITLDLNSDTDSLGGFWQGSAAQAASAYCRTFMQNGKTVLAGTSTASPLSTDQLR